MENLTGIQVAKILGVTPSRVSQLRKNDGLPMEPAAFGQWLRDRNAAQAEALDLAHERARLAKEQADRTALENGQTRRELLLASEVEQVCAMAFAAISATMKSLPDLLERRVGIDAATAEHCEKVIFEALNSLADALATLGMERDDDSHS